MSAPHPHFLAWLTDGITQGFCGPIVCSTHDGIPTTPAEDDSFDDADDPCVPIIRPYLEPTDKHDVETNHPPSQWRKTEQDRR